MNLADNCIGWSLQDHNITTVSNADKILHIEINNSVYIYIEQQKGVWVCHIYFRSNA
jgi:hypothetical protein